MSKINEKELTKLYYTIGEVADLFSVNTSLIRFWEKEFPFIKPKKNKKGNRLFTPKEIVKIDRIYRLVKEKGYTLEGARKALKNENSTAVGSAAEPLKDHSALISRLEALRDRLLSMKS